MQAPTTQAPTTQAPTTQDFLMVVSEWSTSRRAFNTQLDTLRKRVERLRPDAVVIMGIPRHHAKKLCQQDWTKDYYVSKETRSVTHRRSETELTPTPISVVFSKYPTSSEQWFALGPSSGPSSGPSGASDQGFAHIVEICIPLNAWQPSHCPLGLLQEYQLTYDEVSTLTLVVTTTITSELKTSFNPSNVRNSVIFISQGQVVEPQLRLWKKISTDASVVARVSTLGDANPDTEI